MPTCLKIKWSLEFNFNLVDRSSQKYIYIRCIWKATSMSKTKCYSISLLWKERKILFLVKAHLDENSFVTPLTNHLIILLCPTLGDSVPSTVTDDRLVSKIRFELCRTQELVSPNRDMPSLQEVSKDISRRFDPLHFPVSGNWYIRKSSCTKGAA